MKDFKEALTEYMGENQNLSSQTRLTAMSKSMPGLRLPVKQSQIRVDKRGIILVKQPINNPPMNSAQGKKGGDFEGKKGQKKGETYRIKQYDLKKREIVDLPTTNTNDSDY